MGIFSFLGIGNPKIKDALGRGAIVIDVRTANEFDQGKVPGSINIPVDRIMVNAERIRAMKRPVIMVCSSGARSIQAIRILKAKGLKELYDGGSWQNVLKIVNRL